MSDEIKVKVPDIGGAASVDVIELLVKPGDEIDVDTPLITLESDKASMEIPSPKAGKIKSVLVNVGDKVSEGDDILILLTDALDQPAEQTQADINPEEEKSSSALAPSVNQSAELKQPSIPQGTSLLAVNIPDIGGASDVDVIEVMVQAGDLIEKDQALITLEGDKATMDIPSPAKGIVEKVAVKIGDKVSQGSLVLTMKSSDEVSTPVQAETENLAVVPEKPKPVEQEVKKAPVIEEKPVAAGSDTTAYAGPAVRRLAREFGVDLKLVKGSGRKGRISKEDVQNYVKSRLAEKPAASGFSLPEAPAIDFSKFGSIETKPLNKIKRLTGINVHRSWVSIPHVTQFDEADITDLEAFRKSESETANKAGYKLTVLAFVTKVVCKALQVFPQFNASLDKSGENLIYKQYFNIGIAVETPNGLVVPVIQGVDKLSVAGIATEMARLSAKARDKGLMPADMSGGCFTISSLGGIGGTAFTPIVNSPEVAILGLSRSSMKPVWDGKEFKARLMLPLSLSYDHRVIDGAEAARFTRYIAEALADIRKILL
ncbi:pyruvate dehydrogenase E2 component [Legionella birminghamensis]|uniref:Acetyltransferase component of pyruvate dehydrogenase complex n=1 Tax=Legionella birminghamensis TaxID=28083 RepID=A0A378I862_9GAMM|nr:dihydrolipoyllysine-residue acetyltransferase [Legionella birminghamensis]KTC67884.1 pyruvate dehydrogenase E2 component [Legionella birminghamensis]STX31407.1 pyruvate dehydrogenase E2 component [Legionella birminghamensis]